MELLEIEMFDHLTVCKQMTDVWLICLCYKTMLETIYLYVPPTKLC